MLEWLRGSEQAPMILVLLATTITWSATALGAASVFFFREINKRALNSMLGFAAGVMIAASFWSLLAPALTLAEEIGQIPWLVVALGFLAGGFFLLLIDKILPHVHLGKKQSEAEGIPTQWRRSVLLVFSITLHNIPEGLAVGVAFGAVASGAPSAGLGGAIALALGMAIQNMPEGAAVSIPLRREGMSRKKAFLIGQASGVVEPIAGVLGVMAVMSMQMILPFALAFAAGAMIFVVVEELIPAAQEGGDAESADVASIGVMLGFALMMILDVALG